MILLAEDGLEIVESSQVNRDLPSCSSVSRGFKFKDVQSRQVPTEGGDASSQSAVVNSSAPVDSNPPDPWQTEGVVFNFDFLGGEETFGSRSQANVAAAQAAVQQYLSTGQCPPGVTC